VKVAETNIPPRENVTYSKETQTIVVETVDKEGKYRVTLIIIDTISH
jgi:hypothetical protein